MCGVFTGGRERAHAEWCVGWFLNSANTLQLRRCSRLPQLSPPQLIPGQPHLPPHPTHTHPRAEGILFSVRPPKKSWKNIANLSGGEKTLSSLSLVFALHHYKPTPLYVMDEIDAALGEWGCTGGCTGQQWGGRGSAALLLG